MNRIEDENQKPHLSLGDKFLLGYGWVVAGFTFVNATFCLYLIISGKSTFINVLNMFLGYAYCFMFSKSKGKLFLSKSCFLLSLFFVMVFSVIYVLTGKINPNPTPNELLAFLIMAVGVSLILYLYRKFFTEFKHIIKFEPPIQIEAKNGDEE